MSYAPKISLILDNISHYVCWIANINVEIIFSEVMLLDFARNVIDRKVISRFILNSRLHYNVVAGMRSYTTIVTPTGKREGQESEKGKLHIPDVVLPAYTNARTQRES